MSGGAIQSAGLALGGVAPKPLRLFDVEAFLAGAEPRTEVFRQAAEIALRGARPLKQNSFKLDLAKHSVVRALTLAGKGTPKFSGGLLKTNHILKNQKVTTLGRIRKDGINSSDSPRIESGHFLM